MVSAEGDESNWGQRFLLVWAAVGPQSVPAVPVLGASNWSVACLTLPDLDGQHMNTEIDTCQLHSAPLNARLAYVLSEWRVLQCELHTRCAKQLTKRCLSGLALCTRASCSMAH